MNNVSEKYYSALASKCYKNVNMPFKFVEPIHLFNKYHVENIIEHHIPMSSIDQGFVDWLQSMGLYSPGPRFFVSAPNKKYNLHIDIFYPNDNLYTYLNFPFNDNGTIMRWFNLKPESKIHWSHSYANGKSFKVINAKEEECNVVCTMNAPGNQPVLINAGYIHDLINGPDYRHCWSFPLFKIGGGQINWDDAITAFAPYI